METQTQMMLLTIKKLLKSLNVSEGVPEEVYMAARLLIAVSLGEKAESVFVMSVDATDGNYYSKSPHIDLWREILVAAGVQ